MKLHDGAVHVWRVDLDGVPREVERLLDFAELERAQRIVRERARRRWIAARGTLRALLGECLDRDTDDLRLLAGPGGKPKLDLEGAERLHFNLSHSGSLAVYALTELGPVGIDVELLDRRPNAPGRGRGQLRAWVSYEAEAKRTGTGITGGATQSWEPSGWIVELDVGPNAVAALAAEEKVEVVLEPAAESAAVLERQLGGHLAQAGR